MVMSALRKDFGKFIFNLLVWATNLLSPMRQFVNIKGVGINAEDFNNVSAYSHHFQRPRRNETRR